MEGGREAGQNGEKVVMCDGKSWNHYFFPFAFYYSRKFFSLLCNVVLVFNLLVNSTTLTYGCEEGRRRRKHIGEAGMSNGEFFGIFVYFLSYFSIPVGSLLHYVILFFY